MDFNNFYIADSLNILRDYQFVFIYLFINTYLFMYLMNIMFHTTLDAAGVVLRVHYKSMKSDVSCSRRSVRTIFT